MQDVSATLKSKYTDDSSHRIYYHIEFYYTMEMDTATPFLTIENDRLVENDMTIDDGISGGDTLAVGSVYTGQITFKAADVSTTLGGKYIRVYQTIDDLEEEMPIGRYIVTSVEKTSDRRIKTITAYDYTCLFDEDGSAVLAEIKNSETVQDALNVIADHYGLSWETQTIAGATYPLVWDYDQAKDDDIISKDIVAMLGEILGGWIKVNRDGKLYLKTIVKPALSAMETISYSRKNPDYEETEIETIDNVIFTAPDGTVYSANSTGTNAVDLTGNYFLIGGTQESIQRFLSLALSNLQTIQYYPAELEIDGRPYMDAGDFIRFYDGDTELYTLIKERTLSGINNLVSSYKNPVSSGKQEAGYISSSGRQSATLDTVKRVNYNLMQAQQQLAEALANSSGMYETREEQPDGSEILYLHDKPTLAESTNIIKITSDAIGFSTDGGVTYPFGLMINGDVIANILSANGINANWINTGNIVIGGASANADGQFQVYDVNNNLICIIDKNGLDVILGTIAGWIIKANSITSENGTISLNSSQNALNFYSSDGTELMRINNNGVYNYDSTGTLRNLLSGSSNTYYDSSGTRRVVFNSDGFNQYSTDGTYLGHIGRSTVYSVDADGNSTGQELGEIMAVLLEETDEALGWGIFALAEGSTLKQRRVYYCNNANLEYEEDHFYVNCPSTFLRHTETDPYYVKKISFDDANNKFTITAGVATGQVADVTNTFSFTEDASGRVTAITNDTTGRVMEIEYES